MKISCDLDSLFIKEKSEVKKIEQKYFQVQTFEDTNTPEISYDLLAIKNVLKSISIDRKCSSTSDVTAVSSSKHLPFLQEGKKHKTSPSITIGSLAAKLCTQTPPPVHSRSRGHFKVLSVAKLLKAQ